MHPKMEQMGIYYKLTNFPFSAIFAGRSITMADVSESHSTITINAFTSCPSAKPGLYSTIVVYVSVDSTQTHTDLHFGYTIDYYASFIIYYKISYHDTLCL